MDRINEIKEYFRKKAKYYDLVEKQLYWKLSDKLLWYALKKLVLNKLRDKKVTILDAGGGTGRWTIKIIKYLRRSTGVIYDISEDMLKVAQEKIGRLGLGGKIRIINGNIENMSDQGDSIYDLVICFHNVLGFVSNPIMAFKEMYRVLKKGGYLIIVAPNKYHGLFFNIYTHRLYALDSIYNSNLGTFTDDMPPIHFFTPDSLKKMYKEFKFEDVRVYGFPVTIYPSVEETKIKGNTKRIRDILSNPNNFKKIERMERNLIFNEEAAARGNNLLAIGKK
jgi:ubiquinone/menaquinone biosynthesis C-methylase UbiE